MFDVPADRVEVAGSAEPKQLTDVSADEIIALLGREPEGGYRGLYYAWERQQWAAGAIDLDEDARQWRDEIPEGARLQIETAWGIARISERVSELLVPLVDAVPTEEQQVFMTTQLADTARRAVLEERFRAEVAGDRGTGMDARRDDRNGLPAALDGARPSLARPRLDERRAVVEYVAVLGLVVSGGLAATFRFLSEHLRDRGWLDGMRQGINASLRDLTRHIGFARLFTSEYGDEHPSLDSILSLRAPEVVARLAPGGDLPYPATEVRAYASELISAVARESGIEVDPMERR